jgi:acetyl esterase/lipase
MLRWLPAALAALALVPALFTLVKAPSVFTWKVAILAGEFGHLLALGPLALVLWSLRPEALRDGGTPAVLAVVLGVAGLVLYLRPSLAAGRLARALPDRLAGAFGTARAGGSAFSVWRFAGQRGEVKVRQRDVAYTAGDGRTRLTMDLYVPEGLAAAGHPCVVVIHGGGWDGGDRSQLAEVNRRLAAEGFAVAAISYRLAPEHPWPAAREDVVAAVAHLREEAGSLGVDPARIALLGRSAGGQLATAVAYGRPELGIRAVIALYAPHDLHFAWAHSRQRDVLDSFRLMRQYLGGAPEERRAAFDDASAYLAVRPGLPPTLLVHGAMDSLVWHRQSERLAARLTEAGVPNVFLSLPWATHAFDFNPDGPGGQLALHAIRHVLDTAFRRSGEGSGASGEG